MLIFEGVWEYALCRRFECRHATPALVFDTLDDARFWLARHAADSGCLLGLRRVVADCSPTGCARLSDGEVVGVAAAMLHSGALVLTREAVWMERSPAGQRDGPSETASAIPEPARQAPRAASKQERPVYWIEIELAGEDGTPIPDAAYRVTPNGKAPIEGRLDQDGWARVDGLDSADLCEVVFPELDREAWERKEILPAKVKV
jgi:hypothetical protein